MSIDKSAAESAKNSTTGYRHIKSTVLVNRNHLAIEQTYVVCCSSVIANLNRDWERRGEPSHGVVGTDFWHAVEFSRDRCAPAGVSRPVSGQPSHAMTADRPCQRIWPILFLTVERETRSRNEPIAYRVAVGHTTPASVRFPRRSTNQSPANKSGSLGTASGSVIRTLFT
jgi:hypothetical protein